MGSNRKEKKIRLLLKNVPYCVAWLPKWVALNFDAFLSLWPPPLSPTHIPNHVPHWKINTIFNFICASLRHVHIDMLLFYFLTMEAADSM